MSVPFKGVINVDVRDSTPDWTPYMAAAAPEGAPNVLTGRNHHQNACSCITEGSDGFPGANGHIPASCGPMARVMQDNGYNTYWLGKNHNVPVDQLTLGGPKTAWPLNQGWDRFYGFLGGETNQYYPSLMSDSHIIEQPSLPEDGYHLSQDLT